MIFMMIMHHPTEISSILEGVKTYMKEKIIAVFEPHRYSSVIFKKRIRKIIS